MSCSESVNKVVEIYVESMKESSADKVREAFHPNAKVVGHLHGDFLEMSTEDFAGFVAAQEPAEVEYEILSTVVFINGVPSPKHPTKEHVFPLIHSINCAIVIRLGIA